MSSKSSQIPIQNRNQRPARVPAKWRNLPAFGHGITPAMKARPIIETAPNEEIEGCIFDDMCFLMPIALTAFIEEQAHMILRGYHALQSEAWDLDCRNCGCEATTITMYAKRHRNGKPNKNWVRDFIFCPECLTVTEEIFVIRDTGALIDQEDESVTITAA